VFSEIVELDVREDLGGLEDVDDTTQQRLEDLGYV
jgi:hypothetical protein